MAKIVIKHTRIEINNYELGDSPRLEYTFSVWDPITHKSYTKAIEYNPDKKMLIVPRGIDIEYLRNMFMCEPQVDRNCDPYETTDPINIKYLARDERQVNIMKFILGLDQYKYTATKSQLSCNSTTGSGKTFVTVASICYSGSRCIIITSSLQWLEQWKQKILEYTPLREEQLYMISGSSSINKLLTRGNPLQYQIFLASHSTLKSYGDHQGWNKVEEFFKFIKVGMKVYDEAHLYFDNMTKIDFHSNTRKTLYLTATPARSSREENLIYQLYFKNVPSISLFDEENDPHVNYVGIHFSSHPTPLDINRCKNQYGLDRNRYVNYVVQQTPFLKLTAVLIDMVLNKNGKILIYIGTNAAIKAVRDFLIEVFPFLENHIGIYTSATPANEKEEMLYKKIILSTTKSCGAASDIADLGVTINLAEPFRSEVLARQTLGRCRADNTLYLDVVDTGFYQTKKYYSAKKPVFSRYAKSCRDIHMTDEEIDQRYQDILQKYQRNKVMCMRVFKQ